jgi:sulfopyruvate decarboxylase subunit alpha
MIHGIQHGLWNLRARSIVEKDEPRRAGYCGESRANGFKGKVGIRSGCDFVMDNALGFSLQAFAPGIHVQGQLCSLAERAAPNLYSAAALVKSAHCAFEDRISSLGLQRIGDPLCVYTREQRSVARYSSRYKNMPVSLTNSKVIFDALRECDIRLVSALPETWLVHLIRMADDDPEVILVRLAKEEEGVGVSAGAHFAGAKSAMLMQNHGFLASINGIVSFAHLYKIPLLMLISYRGSFGERDPWQTQGGNATEPLLRALGIPYSFLDAVDTVKKRIQWAQTLAESSLQPVALLLTRDLMWEE